jgi:hypothetical protein
MDWQKLRDDATAKAREYAERAKKFSAETAHKSRATLKNDEEYQAFLSEKKAVLVAGSTANATYELAIVRYPEIVTKAWIESATLRYLDTAAGTGFDKKLSVEVNPTVLLFKSGEEFRRIE